MKDSDVTRQMIDLYQKGMTLKEVCARRENLSLADKQQMRLIAANSL